MDSFLERTEGIKREIERKRAKFLKNSLFVKGLQEVSGAERDELIKGIIEGTSIKGLNARFFKKTEGEKTIYFLAKIDSRPNPAAMQYGNILYRTVSGKEFVIKGHFIAKGRSSSKGDSLALLIKWDKQLLHKKSSDLLFNLLEEEENPALEKKQDPNLIRSAAFLLGAELVLGEDDPGGNNHMSKIRDGKPILAAIDRTPGGDYGLGFDFPTFGSIYASYFIKKILANEPYKTELSSRLHYILEELRKSKKDLSDYNKALVDFASEAIIDPKSQTIKAELWDKIKANIENKSENPHHEEYFMCFMESVNNTINLIRSDFSEQYLAKFIEEGGAGRDRAEIAKAQKTFLRNAEKTEKVFAPCLEYYAKIKSELQHSASAASPFEAAAAAVGSPEAKQLAQQKTEKSDQQGSAARA